MEVHFVEEERYHAPPSGDSYGAHADYHIPSFAGAAVKTGGALAFIWLALSVAGVYLFIANGPAARLSLVEWAAVIAAICAPLALIGAGIMLALRFDAVRGASVTGHAQALFDNASSSMRAEIEALRASLGAMHAEIRANHGEVDRQAQKLLAAGDGLARQLSQNADHLSAETGRIAKAAETLDGAAATAKADLGTILADLPRIEQVVQSISVAFREAGQEAEQQSGRIQSGLKLLAGETAATQETTAIATQTLATQIAQIELTSERVRHQLESLAGRLEETIDSALNRTAKALEATRTGVNMQSEALLETVEAARSSLVGTGADAVRNLAESIRQLSAQLTGLNELIDGQDDRVRGLASQLGSGIADVNSRFEALSATGEESTARIAEAVSRLRAELDSLSTLITHGDGAANALIERVGQLRTMLEEVNALANAQLPEKLADAGAVVNGTRDALAQVQAEIAGLEGRLSTLQASAEGVQAASASTIGGLDTGLAAAVERIGALTAQIEDSQARLRTIEDEADDVGFKASSTLLDAIGRARDAAGQAAAHIRTVLSSVAEEAQSALTHANMEALKASVDDAVSDRVNALRQASEDAVATAQAASDRLARQLMTIADTTAIVESRAAEVNAQIEAQNREDFSRQSALLIESLNSAAIDIAKILSHEVTDTAWAAYLKGDRSVFARRAVRLLDAGEAKTILRHYEQEPEFHEQVNRYIHDFEAVIRRVLSERDGGPMAVAMLSSDVGKLYVAVAQAIDRLRMT